MAEDYGSQPIENISDVTTMNFFEDSTKLPMNEAVWLENFVKDKGALNTREGCVVLNPGNALPASIYGVAVFNSTDTLTPQYIAVANGVLYAGATFPLTSKLTGLSTTTFIESVPFMGGILINDPLKGLIYCDGVSAEWAGVPSPRCYKLIEGFESVTGWTLSNCFASLDYPIGGQGKHSIRFLYDWFAPPPFDYEASKIFTAQDLSYFYGWPQGDGSFAANARIKLYMLRGNTYDYAGVWLDLGSDPAFTNRYAINLFLRPEWKPLITTGGQVLEFNILKSDFTVVGSPNWNNIVGIRIHVDIAIGANDPSITLDSCRIEKEQPLVLAPTAGSLNGNYYYRVTYRNARGIRSAWGNISDMITVTNKKIDVIVPTVIPNLTYLREVWRVGGTSSDWRYVGAVTEKPISDFLRDDVAESDLGEYLGTTEYDKPMVAKTFCVHKNKVILGNLTSLDGYRYRSAILISREGSFNEFNYLETFDICKDDGYDLQVLVSLFGRVYAIKEKGIYSFDPDDITIPPILIDKDFGVINPHTCATASTGFMIMTPKKELHFFNGSSFEYVSRKVQGVLNSIPANLIDNISGVFFNQYFLFTVPSTPTEARVVAFYVPTQTWLIIKGWNPRCWWLQTSLSGVRLLFCNVSDGYIYEAFTGDTDAGVPITAVLRSRDSSFIGHSSAGAPIDDPTIRRVPATIYLNCKKLTTTDVTLKIEPFADVVDSGDDIDLTVNLDTHYRKELGVPGGKYWGTYTGMKLTATNRVSIRGFHYSVRAETRR